MMTDGIIRTKSRIGYNIESTRSIKPVRISPIILPSPFAKEPDGSIKLYAICRSRGYNNHDNAKRMDLAASHESKGSEQM
jgi:hypothetical protein